MTTYKVDCTAIYRDLTTNNTSSTIDYRDAMA